MTSTRTEDVRKVVNTAVEQLRTPLLAALGAGNLAGHAVTDAMHKARARVSEGSESARRNFEDLPTDVTTLRERLDPAELRKLVDEYTEAALRLYNKLAESGEQTWDRFLAEPRVKVLLDQVEGMSSEARERVEGMLDQLAHRTRGAGETATEAADDIAAKVEEAQEPITPAPRSGATPTAGKKPAGGSAAPGPKATE